MKTPTLKRARASLKTDLVNAEDNLNRAKASFRSCSPLEMQGQYGYSGRTRQEILDGYQQEVDELKTALRDLNG